MRGSFKSYKSSSSSRCSSSVHEEDIPISDDDLSAKDTVSSPSSTTIVDYTQEKESAKYGTTWIAWVQVINIMLINGCCSLMWGSGSEETKTEEVKSEEVKAE